MLDHNSNTTLLLSLYIKIIFLLTSYGHEHVFRGKQLIIFRARAACSWGTKELVFEAETQFTVRRNISVRLLLK